MLTPVEFGKEFLISFYTKQDEPAALAHFAQEVLWITPEDMVHLRDLMEVYAYIRERRMPERYYVDVAEVMTDPISDTVTAVSYKAALVPLDPRATIYVRVSMVIERLTETAIRQAAMENVTGVSAEEPEGLEIRVLHVSRRYSRADAQDVQAYADALDEAVLLLQGYGERNLRLLRDNRALRRMLGYEDEEYAKRAIKDPLFMVPAELKAALTEIFSNPADDEVKVLRGSLVTKSGAPLRVEIRGHHVYDEGDTRNSVAVVRDIREVEEREYQAARREQLLSEAAERLPGGLCILEEKLYPAKVSDGTEDQSASPRVETAVLYLSSKIPPMLRITDGQYRLKIHRDPFYGFKMSTAEKTRLRSLAGSVPEGEQLSLGGLVRTMEEGELPVYTTLTGASLRFLYHVKESVSPEGVQEKISYLYYEDVSRLNAEREQRFAEGERRTEAAEKARKDAEKARKDAETALESALREGEDKVRSVREEEQAKAAEELAKQAQLSLEALEAQRQAELAERTGVLAEFTKEATKSREEALAELEAQHREKEQALEAEKKALEKERTRLEKALKSQREEHAGLMLRHKETLAELETAQDARRELEESLEKEQGARERFLSELGRELTDPAAVLRQALRSAPDSDKALHERSPRELEQLAAVETLLRRMDGLFGYASTREEDAPRRELFLPGELIKETAQALEDVSRRRRVIFRWEVDPEVPEVLVGDAAFIREALMPVLDNALRYTPRGGQVRLAVRCAAGDPGKNLLEMVVSDTGEGISDELLPRIFEPFTRGEAQPGGEAPGFGLGLAIAMDRVRRMGGSIGVTSTAGAGSEFTLRIPTETALDENGRTMTAFGYGMLRSGGRPAGKKERPRDTGRILLLVGDPIQGGKLVNWIRQDGREAESLAAPDAEKLPEMLSGAEPGEYLALIADYSMPGADGLETARQIRRMEKETGRRPLPILLLTASRFEEDMAVSLRETVSGSLPKPVGRSALSKALHQLLG